MPAQVRSTLINAIGALVTFADAHFGAVMPGFTHSATGSACAGQSLGFGLHRNV